MAWHRKVKRVLRVLVLLFILAAAVFAAHAAFRNNLKFHVAVCKRLPKLADYMKLVPADKRAIEAFVEQDRYAVAAFTKAFSDPVQVSIWDNGGHKHLQRAWKVNEGYLILAAGRDPWDYEMFISHMDNLPEELGEPRVNPPQPVITAEFLSDYEAVFIPIPSDDSLNFEEVFSE